VYWEREGRESVDAVILFLTVTSISLWGGAFFHSLLRLVFSRRRATVMQDHEHC
jgi:hypothetical protein